MGSEMCIRDRYIIPYTLRAMADTLDLSIADVARGTRDTARAVYGL